MASDAVVITGATATGKSAVAVAVAQILGGEIISMDSRQVYRGMDIGTAKPTIGQRGGVPHHGFDVLTPDQRYSAGRFTRDALRWIEDIRSRHRMPVLAGGTGFFLRALLQPMFAEPSLDEAARARLENFLAALPPGRLTTWARALDPERAARLQDRQRLARTVEIALLTGRPLSWWHRHGQAAPPVVNGRVFVLELPRAVLYQRIETRVEEMLAHGLVDEVRDLAGRGYDAAAPGMNATGYRELLPYLRGERTLDGARALIQNATRAYARRQLTWLRNQLPPGSVRLDASAPVPELADRIVKEWRRQSS
jgi:tRNA dimethylallyltransferase